MNWTSHADYISLKAAENRMLNFKGENRVYHQTFNKFAMNMILKFYMRCIVVKHMTNHNKKEVLSNKNYANFNFHMF